MDPAKLRTAIIGRIERESDTSKLDAILRLLDVPKAQWKADRDLVGHVLIAEHEYAQGRAVPLKTARTQAKRRMRP